jgi:hypothetical protein
MFPNKFAIFASILGDELSSTVVTTASALDNANSMTVVYAKNLIADNSYAFILTLKNGDVSVGAQIGVSSVGHFLYRFKSDGLWREWHVI